MVNPLDDDAPGVRVIASAQTWIEGEAIRQLEHVAALPGMKSVVGLPDLYPGRGYPVGMACVSEGHFYPAVLGNDVGCGLSLFQTDAPYHKVDLDEWERRIRKIAFGSQRYWEGFAEYRLKLSNVRKIGTIGGGNHFAQFQKIVRVFNGKHFSAANLDEGTLLLLVQSGSGGYGTAIHREHIDRFGHAGLEQGTPEAEEYWVKHKNAMAWASLNRKIIADRICLAIDIKQESKLECLHTFLQPLPKGEEVLWLHRKGATPADSGLVIIPGTHGDSSYLVAPMAREASLYSIAHGAGRKWQRTSCRERLKRRYKPADLLRPPNGNRLICDKHHLLYEEAPEAYKPLKSIIDDLVNEGLIELVAELAPVLTYKQHSFQMMQGRKL